VLAAAAKVSAIGQITQSRRDFGSWSLRLTARRLIDCPIGTTTANA
jgi:hypothetical protein